MLALARLFVLLFAVLTVIFLVLTFLTRQSALSEARDKWEKSESRIDWETFREREMRVQNKAMRRRLIIGVYVLPTALLAAIVYFVNFA